jgi:hypothetical protein
MTALKVDGSAATQPVSGTFWQATQPISGSVTANAGTNLNTSALALDASISGILVTQGSSTSGEKGPLVQAAVTTSSPSYTTAQTSPLSLDTNGNLRVLVTPSGTQTVAGTVTANAGTGTFAVSAGSLPLPSGASTSAKQPALGTAGSASGDVLTVQGIASMTALNVDGSGVTQPVSGTFWQATQPVSGTVTANAGTNLNTSALALETGGNLATLAGAVSSSKVQANVDQLAGTTTDTNSGNKSAGTLRVVLATDQPQLTNSLLVSQATAANLNATVVGTGTFAVQASQSGTWNVGTVTTVSTVTAVTAITNALPAGTNLLGQVSASHETGTLYSGTTALTPKFATIVASASGATTVVSAVGGKRIRVLRWSLSSNGSVNIKWQSHVTPTDITGLHYLTQYAAAGGAYCPVGIFQTVSGEALDINLSASVAVGGELTYVEI